MNTIINAPKYAPKQAWVASAELLRMQLVKVSPKIALQQPPAAHVRVAL